MMLFIILVNIKVLLELIIILIKFPEVTLAINYDKIILINFFFVFLLYFKLLLFYSNYIFLFYNLFNLFNLKIVVGLI